MKKFNNKGMTLLTLAIYIVTSALVLTIVSKMVLSFRGNYSQLRIKGDGVVGINKLNSELLQDLKETRTSIISHDGQEFYSENYFTLQNGTQYTFDQSSNSIYKNKKKIVKGVLACNFSKEIIQYENIEKEVLIVNIVVSERKDAQVSRQLEYVLRYY